MMASVTLQSGSIPLKTMPIAVFPSRFAVMRIEGYYPEGGMQDCVAKYATLGSAEEAVLALSAVVDGDCRLVIVDLLAEAMSKE